MSDTFFAAGKIGETSIGIEIEADSEPTPAKMLVRFTWGPVGPAAQNLVYGQSGIETRLRTALGQALQRDPNDNGRWSFDWTDANRNAIQGWFTSLITLGMPKESIQRLGSSMDRIPPTGAAPTGYRIKDGFGAVPPGSLITIPGTEKCDTATWEQIVELPGAFCIPQPSNRPMPIHGSWARNYYMVHHKHPSPVYVSAIHVDAIAKIVPSIAVQQQTIRQEMGLDFPIYGPQYFPVPGLNPETRQNYALWPFQAEMVSKFIARRRMITLLQVGTGKTLCALTAAEALFRMGKIDRCVIVAPRALLGQWSAFCRSYYNRDSVILEGPPATRKQLYLKVATSSIHYLIVKYDSWRAPDAQTHLANFLGPRTMVIVDETQKIKHVETKRWKAINKLLDGVRVTPQGELQFPQLVTDYRLLMTGTLVHDKPTDVYGPIQMLSLHVWNTEDEFQRLYFEREVVHLSHMDYRTGQPAEKQRVVRMNPSKIPALQEVVASIGFTKTPQEIGIQLPPLRRQIVRIEPTGNEAMAYKVIKGELERLVRAIEQAPMQPGQIQNLNRLQDNLLATISMERLFSADPALVGLSGSNSAKELQDKIGKQNLFVLSPGSKLQTLIGQLGDFLGSSSWGKVVVFTTFERLFQVFQAMFARPPATLDPDEVQDLRMIQMSSVFYDGSLSQAQRVDVLTKFRSDPRIRILFSTDAGSEGLNLQDVAQFVIHYDAPLSLGTLEQREGRVYRQGQKVPVIITTLLYSPQEQMQNEIATLALSLSKNGYIDPRLKALLMGKADEKRKLMDGL
jgi:superfamily II DNA or RNA helicase